MFVSLYGDFLHLRLKLSIMFNALLGFELLGDRFMSQALPVFGACRWSDCFRDHDWTMTAPF